MAILIEGQTYNENVDHNNTGYATVRVSTALDEDLTFRNNSIISIESGGYMLDAGDEDPASTNGNLDGSIITGNKFTWNGVPGTPITHGLFQGYMINNTVKYNYLDKTPYGILYKSGSLVGGTGNRTNVTGAAAYNIVKNASRMPGRVKGMNGVCFYNNTFYHNNAAYSSVIYVDPNTDTGRLQQAPTGIKIKNNIFYTVNQMYNVNLANSGSLVGFECDYNLYWCESGTPLFRVEGTTYTFAQWQELGYDTHSVVVNPNFIDLINFVPSARLNYGTNLGSSLSVGLSTSATWVVGSAPATASQDASWQVGARIRASAPTANFSSNVNSITAGGSVSFTDTSSGNPTSWLWNFGDGTTSTSQNPNHVYSTAGTYNVTLTVTNAYGSDSEVKNGFIIVTVSGVAQTYYLSPSGSDAGGNGSIGQPWRTITKAMTVALAGDTVLMRAGSYNYTTRQTIGNKHGSAGNYIKIMNYPGETPIVNAISGYTYEEGIYIYDSTYIHIKGLEITGYTQPASNKWGNAIKAIDISHCVLELLNIHHNCFGISLTDDDGVSDDNLILNCDVSYSEDPITAFPPPYDHLFPYGNADGITIRCENSQNTVNTVKGCRMWYCSDDGMDLWENEGVVIVDSCWSFWNGYYPDTFDRSPGDGNGFKLGPTYLLPFGVVLRKVRNCIAFQNPVWGFVRNGCMGQMEIYNNVAFSNGYAGSGGGFFFGNDGSSSDMAFYIKNNIAYDNVNNYSFWNNELLSNVSFNSWQIGGVKTDDDFKGVVAPGVTGARKPDGSLPDLDFMKLAVTSDMVGAGVNVGLSVDAAGVPWGSPPSLGAYEVNTTSTIKKSVIINIVGDSPVSLMGKPSWITVENGLTGVELSVGDPITDGMRLDIYPNSENSGGYRFGFVILRDSLPNPDELQISVVQDMNPNGPTVALNLNEGVTNNLQLTSVGPNTTQVGWNYLDINFTPHNPNYGEGVYLNINYEYYKNGVYQGSGIWSGNNDTPLNRQLSISGTVLTTDSFEVLVWSI